MKGHYLSIAMAVAMTVPAFAGGFEKAQLPQTMSKDVVKSISLSKNASSEAQMKAPAKVATSVDALVGFYTFTYCNYLTENGDEESTVVEAVAGEQENQLVFKSFLGYSGDVVADVNPSEGTLTFHNQDKFWYSTYYQAYTDFKVRLWNEDGRGSQSVDEIVASVDADGKIQFSWRAIFCNEITSGTDPNTGEPVTGGYFFFASAGGGVTNEGMFFEPYDMWEFNADEWEDGGTAEFTDAWLLPMLGVNVDVQENGFTSNGQESFVYNVNYKVSKENKDIILLTNPYGKGSIWTDEQFFINEQIEGYEEIFNISDKDGYIYIDASNPDVVCVRGPIYSGYDSEINGKFYMWNDEGNYKYSYGYDDDTIEMLLEYYEQEVSYKDGNVITIYNCVFGCAGSFDPLGGWLNNNGDAVVMTSYLTLHPGENGVESVEFDSNAPVKYFNLQGVEIANPAKGQLVIKTQGSKAQKMIVR